MEVSREVLEPGIRVRWATAALGKGEPGGQGESVTDLAPPDHYERLGNGVDAGAAPLREPGARGVRDSLSPAVADHCNG